MQERQEDALQQRADSAQDIGLGYLLMAGSARYTAVLDACVLFPLLLPMR